LCGTRQRALCRVPEIKHSAKNMALGKEPNSGSGGRGRDSVSGLHFIPARTYDYTYVYRSNPMQVVVADHHASML
jgi:hypothetical protein